MCDKCNWQDRARQANALRRWREEIAAIRQGGFKVHVEAVANGKLSPGAYWIGERAMPGIIRVKTKRRHKYNARRVDSPDGRFDSQKEYRRWCELKLLERAGAISQLKRQMTVELVGANGGKIGKAVLDFAYMEAGKLVFEDCKGYRTSVWRLKKKLLAAQGVEVKET